MLGAQRDLHAFAQTKLPLDALGRVFAYVWTLQDALDNELADVVTVLLATRDCPCAPGLADSVAAYGHLHMLQNHGLIAIFVMLRDLHAFARTKLPLDTLGRVFAYVWTLQDALDNELPDVVTVLLATRDCPCAPGLADSVAAYGHLHMLQLLHRFRAEGFSTDAMDGAARSGHLDVVQFLHANRDEGCTSQALDAALDSKHLNVVRFLLQNRPEKWSGRATLWAVENGDLQTIRDILERNKDTPTAEAKVMAYKHKQTEMLKVLYEEGTDTRSSYTLVHACADNNLEMVQYLTKRGEGFVKSAMSEAIAVGALEIKKDAPLARWIVPLLKVIWK
ncbi:Hypothetical protein PHPALM_9620 [Phytophthora palmivora]|uniref:Uncharacterized protein n=1 Tax=Phytophthora palmivora TaxID=4796 RepID=A0A2P4Y6U4_9STRA|nr:Hypothetical protein PHPALM_9620 [Phytophthora palmivora]